MARYLTFLSFLFVTTFVFAQSTSFEPNYDILPPSPTAAALGKYGEVPVSMATGTPNIGIPLASITGKSLGLNVSLSYNASGIKLDEVPSWVGLGWSLNAGGVITRAVKGLPDGHYEGWLATASDVPLFQAACPCNAFFDPGCDQVTFCYSSSCNFYADEIQASRLDPEPDEFYFNFGGKSGKFMFDENGTPRAIPHQNFKISYSKGFYNGNYTPTTSVGQVINTFTITDTDGTIYIFATKEMTQQLLTQNPVPQVSAWYLTKVISADRKDEITLNYSNHMLQMRSRNAVSKVVWGMSAATGDPTTGIVCDPNAISESDRSIVTETYAWHLSEIVSSKGKIVFTSGDRTDLTKTANPNTISSNPTLFTQGKRLNALEIYTGGNLLKSYSFAYSTHKHRMYLDQITENGHSVPSVSTKIPGPHSFTYYQRDQLPEPVWTYYNITNIYSENNGIDMWGYYNGVVQDEIIPTIETGFELSQLLHIQITHSQVTPGSASSLVWGVLDELEGPFDIHHIYHGADRSSNEEKMKYGILTRVDYPTGGYTEFDFEAHRYSKVGGKLESINGIPVPGHNPSKREFLYALDDQVLNKSVNVQVTSLNQEFIDTTTHFNVLGQDTCSLNLDPNDTLIITNAKVQILLENFYIPVLPNDPFHYGKVILNEVSDPANPVPVATWDVDLLLRGHFPNMPSNNISPCQGSGGTPPANPTCFQLDTCFYLGLPIGVYKLEARAKKNTTICDCNPPSPIDAMRLSANIDYQEITGEVERLGGGLRIREIRTNDGDATTANDIIKTYTYQLADNPCRSSGVLTNMPSFSSTYTGVECNWTMGFSSSQVTLGRTGGSIISYSEVVETIGSNNGKTLSKFSTAWDYPDAITCTDGSSTFSLAFPSWEPDTMNWSFSVFFPFSIGISGKSISKKLTVHEFGNLEIAPCQHPYAPIIDNSWQRGDLIEQLVYDKDNNLLQKSENHYRLSLDSYWPSPINTKITGVYTYWVPQPSGCIKAIFIDYTYTSGLKYLFQSATTLYDDTGQEFTTTTNNYHYLSPHGLLKRSRVANSDGMVRETKYKYAYDYEGSLSFGSGANLDIDKMLAKNMGGIPIEIQIWEGDGANMDLIAGSVTSYKDFGNQGDTIIKPHQLYVLESTVPISTSTLNETVNGDGEYLAIIPNTSYYKEREILDFSSETGLIKSYHRVGGIEGSFIYDDEFDLPIAQVINGSSDAIAYSSFEYDDANLPLDYEDGGWEIERTSAGGWSSAIGDYKTGGNGFNISPARKAKKQNLAAGDYRVSFWYKSGRVQVLGGATVLAETHTTTNHPTTLTYFEATFPVTGGQTIEITSTDWSTKIDELRLMPSGAQMSTYTYDSRLRLMNSTDVNNRTSTFEYDELGRLSYAKDHQGNYLQGIAYGYEFSTNGYNKISTRQARVAATTQSAFDNLSATSDYQEAIQYFDGLGRPIQSIDKLGTPTKGDIVSFQEYDAFGRTPIQYLPYVRANNGGAFRSNPIGEQAFYYDQTNFPNIPQNDLVEAHSETVYEASPLNRVIEQGGPGAAWQVDNGNGVSGHTTKSTFRTNTALDIALHWREHTNGEYYAGVTHGSNSLETYPVGSLAVQEVEDPNGNTSTTYTDKFGRTIMTRSLVGDPVTQNPHDAYATTYYIYDDFGRVKYVIQPEGNTTASLSATNYILTADLLNDFAFQYVYDKGGRVIEKKVPGADWVHMVYDPLDRVVATQDGNQRQTHDWSFTKYDVLGRPIMTGIFDNPSSYPRQDVQNQLNTSWGNGTFPLYETPDGTNYSTQMGYTNQAFPLLADMEIHSVTYYDHYDFDQNGTDDETYTTVTGFTASPSYEVLGQVTGIKIRVLEPDSDMPDWLTTVTFYDDYGRELQTKAGNHLADGAAGFNYDLVTNAYSFIGEVTKTQQVHNHNLTGSDKVEILKTFNYDHRSRLLQVKYQVDGGQEVILSSSEYNELGQLIEKNLHSKNNGANYVQSLDYAYNIQGWLTDINDINQIKPHASCYSGGGGKGGSGKGILLDKVAVRVFVETAGSNNDKYLKTQVFTNNEVTISTGGNVTGLINAGTVLERSVLATTVGIDTGYVDTILIDFPQVPVDSNTMTFITAQVDSTIMAVMGSGAANTTDKVKLSGASTDLLREEWNSILDHDDNQDQFAEHLDYNEDDGNMHGDATVQYNGNIRSMQIRTANNCLVRRWDYSYDPLNRLTNAHYKARNGLTSSNPWTEEVGRYSTTGLNYDHNGNILGLTRYGKTGQTTFGKMDEISYAYTGNRLIEVSDLITTAIPAEIQHFIDGATAAVTPSNPLTHEYRYDNSGNLTEDKNKGLDAISYNHLNKPTEVELDPTKKIAYIYSADGTKLRQRVTNGSVVEVFDYVNGFHYKDEGTGKELQFFSTEEGRMVMSPQGDYYEYSLKDHLGNTRVTVRENPFNVGMAMLMQETHYYAFGSPQLGRNWQSSSWRYGFNGMEKDDEIKGEGNSYDFGARIYDPRIGRWLSRDAFEHLYVPISPYAFALNNPLIFIDPDGNTIFDKNGKPVTINENSETGQLTASDITGTSDETLIRAIIDTYNGTETGKSTIQAANSDDIAVQVIVRDELGVYKEDGKFGTLWGYTVYNKLVQTLVKGHWEEVPKFKDKKSKKLYDSRIYLFNTTIVPNKDITKDDFNDFAFVTKKGYLITDEEAKAKALKNLPEVGFKAAYTGDTKVAFDGLSEQETDLLERMKIEQAKDKYFGNSMTFIHEFIHSLQFKGDPTETARVEEAGGNIETPAYKTQLRAFEESPQSKDSNN